MRAPSSRSASFSTITTTTTTSTRTDTQIVCKDTQFCLLFSFFCLSFLQPFKLKNPKEEEGREGEGNPTHFNYQIFSFSMLCAGQFAVCFSVLTEANSLTHSLTQLPEIAFYIYYTIRQKEGKGKGRRRMEQKRSKGPRQRQSPGKISGLVQPVSQPATVTVTKRRSTCSHWQSSTFSSSIRGAFSTASSLEVQH